MKILGVWSGYTITAENLKFKTKLGLRGIQDVTVVKSKKNKYRAYNKVGSKIELLSGVMTTNLIVE